MHKTAVLLATYNAKAHLAELLDSLMNQTYEDFEIHYHDDGSTDGTLEIMEKYNADYPGKFFRIEGEPTGGAKQNFMYMLSKVEADYYFFCDDDDVWKEDKIKKELTLFDEADIPEAVFCDLQIVDNNLNEISPTFFAYVDRNPARTKLSQLLIENMAPGCSMAINRKLRDLAIKQKELSQIPMHDHFIMALAAATGEIRYMDEPLVLYRQTGENEVGAVHVGILGKVKRNLTDIFSGRVKKEKKAFHMQGYNLAEAIAEIIDNQESKSFLEAFLETKEVSKFSRIRFYKKNSIDKNSGNFWYYLWL